MTLIERLEGRQEALTVQEVAELLGVSDKHIYEMAADGTLPSFHIGRSIRLDPQDVADWLRKKKSTIIQCRDAKRAERHKVMVLTKQGSDRTVYGILRRKVDQIEAVSIDDPSQK